VTRLMPALALVATVLLLAACGGGDDDESTTTTDSAPATTAPAPSQGTPPPSGGQLPPQLVECFEDKGIEVDSVDEIHSAPPEVVQECFSALHGGGGPP
jgi:ABC-type glycerol-3-phosphate transport system substrate-binding protein